MPKRPADVDAAPRRSTRPRRTITEARAAESDAVKGPAPKVLPKYKPKQGSAENVVESAVSLDAPDKRDSRGRLVFSDVPDFRPTLRPKDVIQAGSFGGIYFHPRGGRAGIISPKGVAIDHKEFPADWFEGLEPDMYRGRKYRTELNKYKVNAGQNQAAWEEKGWIKPELDPRGWFQWYCRFYMGRRTDDDERQIKRWRGVAGEKGRWKRALVNRVLAANKHFNDATVSPVLRQTLLHWAYELTERDFDEMRKRI
ncbi:hypothetical protein WJX75_000077 [Coccomyxa subellipsoidea]|uniref:Uncharacterized protein n=1 Tax=Coccomyxa subellipsoidea TaxID=248742 RepID=A0ABR2YV04_9CHLO